MHLEIGNKVTLIDQDIQGIIIKIKGSCITIRSQFDLELNYPIEKIVKIEEDTIKDKSFKKPNQKYDYLLHIKKPSSSPPPFPYKEKNKYTIEIDLHIEKTPYRNLNGEILLKQLEIVKESLAFFYNKNKPYKRIIFIHGYGKGILRKELRDLIKFYYPALEYLDASYQEYGFKGATEARIKY